ncbi:MAG: hypothetical protein Q7S74_05395 [Nanoarchaeota archaeon]|nr:hypothetical protein [Nanoarchaeota archaeon]
MVNDQQKIKMALISGASHALKYKQENPRATDTEVVGHIAREAKIILGKLDQED